jgi:ACS family hexuronate transporter-like MFS transporter
MFASTALNYMDRQAIALVRPQVQAEFAIDYQTFGWVMAAFSLTYALLQVPAGYMADRFDVRQVYPAAVAWWSLAGMGVALAPSLGVLIALRVLLGVGESFNWPCALRITSRILPPRDRSLGNGIFNSGAAVGAVLTPLVVPLLATAFGWRSAFLLVGALGFAWVVAWLSLMRAPQAASLLGDARRGTESTAQAGRAGPTPIVWLALLGLALGSVAASVAGYRRYGLPAIWLGVALFMFGLLVVARLLPMAALGDAGWARGLGTVVRRRRFWVLVVVTISINTCWHFLVSWLPTYLQEDRPLRGMIAWVERGMRWFRESPGWNLGGDAKYLSGALLTAAIFLAADAGNLLGGAASRRLAARGVAADWARVVVMAACAALISTGAWIGALRVDGLVIGVLALMAFGAAAFMANYFAFCQDVDARHTGLVVGILGGLGNLFAAGVQPFAGWVKDTYKTFDPIFVLVGLSPLLGVLALVFLWRPAGRRDLADMAIESA